VWRGEERNEAVWRLGRPLCTHFIRTACFRSRKESFWCILRF
jgi:hypothetical protein